MSENLLNIIEVKPINIIQHPLLSKGTTPLDRVVSLINNFDFDYLFFLTRNDHLATTVVRKKSKEVKYLAFLE